MQGRVDEPGPACGAEETGREPVRLRLRLSRRSTGNETGCDRDGMSLRPRVKQEYTVTVRNGFINGTQAVTAPVASGRRRLR